MTQYDQKKKKSKSKQKSKTNHLGPAPLDIYDADWANLVNQNQNQNPKQFIWGQRPMNLENQLKQIQQEETKNKRKTTHVRPTQMKTPAQKPYRLSKTGSTQKQCTKKRDPMHKINAEKLLSKPSTSNASAHKATGPVPCKRSTNKSMKSSAEKPYPMRSKQVKQDPMLKINAECDRINSACNNIHKLKSFHLKLAIFEKKTFKNIKYDSKCAHSDCKEKAPKDFPSSDLYICNTHARQAGLDCQEKLRAIADKLREGSSSHTTETDEKMNDNETGSVDAVMRIPDGFIASLMDGSINETVKYPKFYWSLLMTKLLTRLRYEKSMGNRKNTERIRLINNTVKLLVVFRYFMNPTGAQLLQFIIDVLPHLGSVGPVLHALNAMIVVILGSVVAMYAVAFIGSLAAFALVCNVVEKPTKTDNVPQLIACLVAGTALTAAGTVLCIATLGIGVPFSAPLFASGGGFFVRAGAYAHDNKQGNEPNGNNPTNASNDNNPGHVPNGNNPGQAPNDNNPGHAPRLGAAPNDIYDLTNQLKQIQQGNEPNSNNPGHAPNGNNEGNAPHDNNPGNVNDQGNRNNQGNDALVAVDRLAQQTVDSAEQINGLSDNHNTLEEIYNSL
eukprot:980608_1